MLTKIQEKLMVRVHLIVNLKRPNKKRKEILYNALIHESSIGMSLYDHKPWFAQKSSHQVLSETLDKSYLVQKFRKFSILSPILFESLYTKSYIVQKLRRHKSYLVQKFRQPKSRFVQKSRHNHSLVSYIIANYVFELIAQSDT